jgi:hypothetical protein
MAIAAEAMEALASGRFDTELSGGAGRAEKALAVDRRLHGQRVSLCGAIIFCVVLLQGCAVVAVVDTVGTVAVKTVGLAAEAAIGVVKITGRAVGATADAIIPGSD